MVPSPEIINLGGEIAFEEKMVNSVADIVNLSFLPALQKWSYLVGDQVHRPKAQEEISIGEPR